MSETSTRAAVHFYTASVAAQTAEINRLIDRVEHLERLVHKCINDADGDGR